MRLSLIPVLAAGATLVAASPIRLEVISVSESSNPVPIRFGFGAHPANNEHIATMIKTGGPMGGRRPCGGHGRSRFRQKAIELSNTFRKALGLPIIEINGQHMKVEEQELHILPFIGTPPTFVPVEPNHEIVNLPHPHPHHHHSHPHHGSFKEKLAKVPFIDRLVISLDTLGTWEGRAVAFVLGCGLGVLLRMFWVLTVVAFRTIKGSGRQEDHYVLFVEELVEEEPTPFTPAPPTYTVGDHKENLEKDTATPAGN